MTAPLLRRIDLTELSDRSISDRAQVPMVGARVEFYRQGATLAAGATIGGGGLRNPRGPLRGRPGRG